MRCLIRDTDGQALLETLIVLPILITFTMLIIDFTLLANAKQLANYAAYCAARTASVYGVNGNRGNNAHFAAAMAMSSISPKISQDGATVLSAYGMANPTQTMQTICNIPGFQGGTSNWTSRLAGSYIRTSEPTCDTARVAGKSHKYVTVDLTYVYSCSVFPFGTFWGHSDLTHYLTVLQVLPFYPTIQPTVTAIQNAWQWNVLVHGHAVMDYWAG